MYGVTRTGTRMQIHVEVEPFSFRCCNSSVAISRFDYSPSIGQNTSPDLLPPICIEASRKQEAATAAMSTLTSTDMGELKRPTTRVHAPPGGGSSWSFGDDPTPAHTGRKRFVQPQGQVQQDTKMESPRATPEPAPVEAQTAAQPSNVPHGAVRIALLKTSNDAELVDRVVQNCFEKLEGQSVSSETFTVASLEQLPYAANKLTQFGGFDGVICFGFLNTQDPQFPALSTALTQSFIDISVKNVRPVVRAVYTGEPRVASVKVKGGWGAEFADGVVSLVQLGGFKGSK
ncbi:hypothetical protein V7S43_009196 [Phytophthora oleae]|uniref:6,7-dimethyl-8-ribityllumazine synthase n=1 Tax=Phytophthora oleae TaxID=2107226 RepID=A0ABD3FIN4_9STRA